MFKPGDLVHPITWAPHKFVLKSQIGLIIDTSKQIHYGVDYHGVLWTYSGMSFFHVEEARRLVYA